MLSEQSYGPVLAVYPTLDLIPPKVCEWCLALFSDEGRHGNHPLGLDSSPIPEDISYCGRCQEREGDT
jgi:hypothetical protein